MKIEISVYEDGRSIVIKGVSVDQIDTFKDIFGDPIEEGIRMDETNNQYLLTGEINRNNRLTGEIKSNKFNYSVYDKPNYGEEKYTIMFQKNNKESKNNKAD